MSSETNLVQRHDTNERINHWVLAITFILLALSGLALFHPAFFFLTNLFGGGTWSRILHPFIGVVMFLSFLGMAAKVWKDNHITGADREWARHFGEILANRAKNLPEIGKYNLGQKYVFWVLVYAIPILLVTGVIIWQPYFTPAFPINLVRFAVLIHALAAFIAIIAIIIHIYAAIWTRGSIRAMTRGTVTVAWAKHHHPAWYKEVSKEVKQ
ncbi:MAG TPA: formate dehydrogenase subunit gamma [Gallionella sp.]|nr:formate dehydrogenase subunit gamma [Gallionella sp.]